MLWYVIREKFKFQKNPPFPWKKKIRGVKSIICSLLSPHLENIELEHVK